MMLLKTIYSILTLAFLNMQLSCQANDQKNSPPNVLMISIDDLNDWIGVLGAHPDVKTPNIDRLAAEGLTFTRGYVTTAICSPSLATMLTGLHPHQHGITGNDPHQGQRGGHGGRGLFPQHRLPTWHSRHRRVRQRHRVRQVL